MVEIDPNNFFCKFCRKEISIDEEISYEEQYHKSCFDLLSETDKFILTMKRKYRSFRYYTDNNNAIRIHGEKDIDIQELITICETFKNINSLDLENNHLKTIPSQLFQLPYLTELNLSNNKLAIFPEILSENTQLLELDISNNSIQSLPPSFILLKSLEEVKLNGNKLETLPECLLDLHLISLDISNNPMRYFLRIKKEIKIKSIFVDDDLLEKIPHNVVRSNIEIKSNTLLELESNLKSIWDESVTLCLRKKEIKINYEELDINKLLSICSCFPHLLSLSIRGRGFTQLPEKIGNFKHLEKLNLYCYDLAKIPSFLFQLPHLEYLSVYSQKIEDFPEISAVNKKIKKLDISDNSLQSLPVSFTKLKGLIDVNLENNQLLSLPDDLFDLPLTSLKVSNNKLKYIPKINKNSKIKSLTLNNNQLKEIPPSIMYIHSESLDLRNNHLKTIPNQLFQLPYLTELNLSNNELTEFPEFKNKNKKLKKLDISNNSLQSLPVSFTKLEGLIDVNLENNQLLSLPDDFFDLPLTSLKVSNNKLKYIPKINKNHKLSHLSISFSITNEEHDIWVSDETIQYNEKTYWLFSILFNKLKYLKNLKILGICKTSLKNIPESIKELKNLEMLLIIDNDKLRNLPKALIELPNLQYLILRPDMIDYFPNEFVAHFYSQMYIDYLIDFEDLKRRKELSDLKDYKKMNLGYDFIYYTPKTPIVRYVKEKYHDFSYLHPKSDKWPGILNSLHYHTRITINKTQLEEIPDEIRFNSNIRYLDLANNSISKISRELGKLKNLIWLNLENNLIKTVPEGIYPRLKCLILNLNRLDHIPISIYNIRTLNKLNLSQNNLTDIPEEIQYLNQLKVLDLSSNKLTRFPKEIINLNQLEVLDLSFNQISEIPEEINELKKLRIIYLVNLHITNFPDFFQKNNVQVITKSYKKNDVLWTLEKSTF